MKTMLAAALATIAVVFAFPFAALAQPVRWHWSLGKVMQLIDRTRIRVGDRIIRIDAGTTLCSGVGRGVRRQGIRAWSEFDCTYSVFVGAGIYDCGFRVDVVGRREYRVTHIRWLSGAP